MNKLLDLRNHLLAKVPELARGPDRLLTFIEDGTIVFYPGENLSHQLKMTAKIIVTDWTSGSDKIILPVLEWMAVRELGLDPNNSIRFEAEITATDKVDLALSVDLIERVVVTKTENGYEASHVLPPHPLRMNDDASLSLDAESPGDANIYE